MRIAGVDIGGTSIKAGIVDEELRIVQFSSTPSPRGDAEALADAVARIVRSFGTPFAAVGVGCAGRIDLKSGAVTASNLDFIGVPLREMLESRLDAPVYIDNDAQAALLAEWQCGVCKGIPNVIYLTLGTGVGGAMMIEGRPYRGTDNAGGEIGHMITHFGGEKCTCGARGCFECYASVRALRRMAGGLPAERILEKAKGGDARMGAVLDRYVDELCAGMVGLIRIFAPGMIVLGGGLSGAGVYFLELVTERLREAFSHAGCPSLPAIALAEMRNHAGVAGGAAIAKFMMGDKH